jgi:outer membrane receptor for ferrienterochelin and colicins
MNMPRSLSFLWAGSRARYALKGRRLAARSALLLLGLALTAALQGAPEEVNASTQELKKRSLEELMQMEIPTVYGASKHEQKITEAPSSVSIVTRDDIQQLGHRTLADVLRSVRGFYVTSDRNYSYVGLRGINRPGDYGGGVLVMIDGHRLNDPVANEAFNGGEFPLDVDLIDRVEVIRGPGSALYGNNAFFAVVNVITRRGRDLRYGETSFSAGSFDSYSGRFSLGHSFTNGLELLLSGTYFDSQGHDSLYYPEFNDVNGGRAINLDGESRKQAFLSLSYKDFTLEGSYGDRIKDMPTGGYGSIFNLGPNQTRDQRAYLEMRFRHEWDSGWLMEARLGYDHFFYDGYAPYDGEEVGRPAEAVWTHDIADTQWWGGELQVSRTFFDRHRVTLGLEGRDELQVRQLGYWVDPHVTINDINTPGGNFGTYLQDEFSIRTNLVLNAGVRFDYFTSFGSTVNPRAALIYSPWQTTTFKGLYGQAYRAPNAYEFDYTSIGYANNHALEPETIRSYELIWEQQLSKPLRLTTSLFYNQIENQIIQVDESANSAVGGYIFRNLGSTDVKGVETELEARWASGLRGRISYTLADATDRAGGARVSNSPQHVGKLSLSVPLYREKVFAGLELQALSARQSATTSDTTPGYLLANFTLFSRELVKGLEVSASVYNLFDRHYSDPVGPDFTQQFIQQDGRTFRVKLTYRF